MEFVNESGNWDELSKAIFVDENGNWGELSKAIFVNENGNWDELWSASNGKYVALASDSSGWGIFVTEDLTTWVKKCALPAEPAYDSATNFFYLNGRYFIVYNTSWVDNSYLFYSDDGCETWTQGITSVSNGSNTYKMCRIKKIKDVIVGYPYRSVGGDYDKGCFGITYDGVTWSYFTAYEVGLGYAYSTKCANFAHHVYNGTDYFVIRTSYSSSPAYYLYHYPLSQLKEAYTTHSLGNYEKCTNINDGSTNWFVTGMLESTPIGLTSQYVEIGYSYNNYGLRGQTYNGSYGSFINYSSITTRIYDSSQMYAFKTNHTTTTELYYLFRYNDGTVKYYNIYNGVIVGTYVPNANQDLKPLVRGNSTDWTSEMKYGVYTDRTGTADGLKVGVVYNQTNVYKYDSGGSLTIIPTSLTFEGNLFEKLQS